jgi:hypothetical protein
VGVGTSEDASSSRNIVTQHDELDFDALKVELQMLMTPNVNGSFLEYNSLSTPAAAMAIRPPEVRSLFPQVIRLTNLLSIVLATSATAERSFSCLRRLKTWLKSTMSQKRLNSIAILNAHRDISPDIDSVLSEFVGLNDVRSKIFGAPKPQH